MGNVPNAELARLVFKPVKLAILNALKKSHWYRKPELLANLEILNFFGDRVQTGAYVARKLTDPSFVAELSARVFDRSQPPHQSAQIVFRVDYSRGVPTGLVYLTHRVRYPDKEVGRAALTY